jgi:FKBP-type peptidyl-prolyl cis-trans isomerase 2
VVNLATAPLAILAFAAAVAFAESPGKEPAKGGDPVIQSGSTVKMEYTLTDEKGQILDTNKGQEPLIYTHGQGQIIPGLEKALNGLHAGDQKHVIIPPDEAYGPVRREAIVEVPKDRIPVDLQKVGARLMAKSQNGPPMPFLVKEIREKTVLVDGNHPLAGKTLTFDVKIVGVEPARSK